MLDVGVAVLVVASALRLMLIERSEPERAHIAVPLSDAIADCYKRLHVYRALCIQTGSVKSIAHPRMYRHTCSLQAELFHSRVSLSVGKRLLLEEKREMSFLAKSEKFIVYQDGESYGKASR